MSRMLTVITMLIGAGAMAGGAFVAIHPAEADSHAMSVAHLAGMQRLADASCRSERRVGDGGAAKCWAEFERQMPGSDWYSSCEPSIHTRCSGPGLFGGPDCVTMTRQIYNYQLCAEPEVDVIESVLNAEAQATRGKGPFVKTDSVYRDMIAGKPLPQPGGPGGCGG